MRKMPEQERDSLNNTHYQKGDDLYKQGNYDDALLEFKKALKAWPTASDTAWAIADCYSELLKPRLAEKFYRLALDTCSIKKRASLLYNIGNALFDQRKYKDALMHYEKISKQNRVYKQARKNIKLVKSKIAK